MVRWTMVIDVSKCIACYNCFIACKDEFWDNDYLPYSVGIEKHGQDFIKFIKKEGGKYPFIKVAYMPISCMHCNDAPCIKVAKNNAVYKRDDGIVIIDPEKAKGQRQIVDACPYNVITWNEKKQLPQKCTFCVHRLVKGQLPKCVEVCPSGARIFGDLDDPNSEVSKLVRSGIAEVYRQEFNTKPNVYYVNLHLITKYFIAGSVVFRDTDECAENVNVVLVDEETGESKNVKTDFFGTFVFEGLERDHKYSIKLEYPGYKEKKITLLLEKDTYLGLIFLERE